ncbi:hypothetical protein LBMAG51_10950 [Phycisphaerae bacterium]|nr:hypothetical protein LBMAG51_10950 [Phycisphaerae bacterium]
MLKKFNEFMQNAGHPGKPWKAKKAEVLSFWKNLNPSLPIQMKPVSEHHKGTRFRSDGLRITGSAEFINSVICRLKDIASFESGEVRLDVEYRQVEPKGDELDSNFVFYVHLVKDQDQLNPKG